MSISRQDLEHTAKLAHLSIADTQKEQLLRQLEDILTYVQKLDELDTSAIEPTAHPINSPTVFRDDHAIPSGLEDQIIANAPDAVGRFFSVPKI